MNRDQRQRYRQVRLRIYGPLPTIGCKGLCAASCGPVGMSELERLVIEKRSGHVLDVGDDGRCNHLVGTRCSVYAERPLLCRLYGVAEGLECEHGCAPSRVLPREEAAALFAEVAELGGPSSFGPITEALLAHVEAGLTMDRKQETT